jgi:hypothetical protein
MWGNKVISKPRRCQHLGQGTLDLGEPDQVSDGDVSCPCVHTTEAQIRSFIPRHRLFSVNSLIF